MSKLGRQKSDKLTGTGYKILTLSQKNTIVREAKLFFRFGHALEKQGLLVFRLEYDLGDYGDSEPHFNIFYDHLPIDCFHNNLEIRVKCPQQGLLVVSSRPTSISQNERILDQVLEGNLP